MTTKTKKKALPGIWGIYYKQEESATDAKRYCIHYQAAGNYFFLYMYEDVNGKLKLDKWKKNGKLEPPSPLQTEAIEWFLHDKNVTEPERLKIHLASMAAASEFRNDLYVRRECFRESCFSDVEDIGFDAAEWAYKKGYHEALGIVIDHPSAPPLPETIVSASHTLTILPSGTKKYTVTYLNINRSQLDFDVHQNQAGELTLICRWNFGFLNPVHPYNLELAWEWFQAALLATNKA